MGQHWNGWQKTGTLAAVLAAVAGGLLAGTTPAGAAPATGAAWLPATPSAWNLVVDKHTTPSMTITRGVTEHSDTLDSVSGRQHTQVMDVDLTDPNVRLVVVDAGDVVTDPQDETVGSMAARTHAVAGLNGDFFEINASGRPLGGVITDGQLLKSPRPDYNAQLTVRADGSMAIGQENAGDFRPGGTTVLAGGSGTGALPAVAAHLPIRPAAAQFLGDMSADGQPADLDAAKTAMGSLGVPFRDAAGDGETSGGALPENGNFAADFGQTHYSYVEGGADWIVTDSSHGGLLASDPFGVPEEAQFADRWEAQEYVRLIQRYQQTHPDRRVVMLYGHANGFAEQILDPDGTPSRTGVPQLVTADLGATPAAPADHGGFTHVTLLHVNPSGDIQFSVEPVLSSITVAAASPVAMGAREALSANGSEVDGGDMPIADPASHGWTSSDPGVATVDSRTGVVTGHRPGTAVVSVRSGGITGSVGVTVK